MIINRTNFFSNLEKITKIIKQSQFISIDLEMSGLNKGEAFRSSSIDSVIYLFHITFWFNINK